MSVDRNGIGDQFDLAASFLPEDRDVEWTEFVALAVKTGVIASDPAWTKVFAQGVLTTLRAAGAVSATGIPPTVRRLPRPERAKSVPTPEFTPSGSSDMRDDIRRLERENAALRRRVAELESSKA